MYVTKVTILALTTFHPLIYSDTYVEAENPIEVVVIPMSIAKLSKAI